MENEIQYFFSLLWCFITNYFSLLMYKPGDNEIAVSIKVKIEHPRTMELKGGHEMGNIWLANGSPMSLTCSG